MDGCTIVLAPKEAEMIVLVPMLAEAIPFQNSRITKQAR